MAIKRRTQEPATSRKTEGGPSLDELKPYKPDHEAMLKRHDEFVAAMAERERKAGERMKKRGGN